MRSFLVQVKSSIRSLTPRFLLSWYHFAWAALGAFRYQYPSREITLVGVTGTKGKSSTLEFANAIFKQAGYKTALASTIRFEIDGESRPNKYKMTMPGHLFLQRFLREAVDSGCDIALLEMTSEGVLQHRHRFLDLNALVFTNLSPEHIESHGSMDNYVAAKLKIGGALVQSRKRPRIMVANADDIYGARFLSLNVDVAAPFSLEMAAPYTLGEHDVRFTYGESEIRVQMPGTFMIYNALAAAELAAHLGVDTTDIAAGLSSVSRIPGRAEEIDAGQSFTVVVDYAHTTDSLRAIYEAYGAQEKVCVLGATGGGRDTWKRPEMGRVAEEHCRYVILTNEDPYNEDPEKIVKDVASGMEQKPEIVMDRRAAIRRAISLARAGMAVMITGKGTDPYIMGANGSKEPWSDAAVAREELRALQTQ